MRVKEALTKNALFQDHISDKTDAVSIVDALEDQLTQQLENNYKKKLGVTQQQPSYSPRPG